jgi:hypothetical protein
MKKASAPTIFRFRDADTLLELTETSKRAVILAAAWLGQARLIDNQSVTLASRQGLKIGQYCLRISQSRPVSSA